MLATLIYNVLIAGGSDPAVALAIGILSLGCGVATLVAMDVEQVEFAIPVWAIPVAAMAFATHQTITTGNVVAYAVLACILPFALKREWSFRTITSRICALFASSLLLAGLHGTTTPIGFGLAVGLWATVAIACIRPRASEDAATIKAKEETPLSGQKQ